VIVQLQALLRFSYKETGNLYYKRLADSEEKVLLRADYIGTPIVQFKKIIEEDLHPHAVFINTVLALSEDVNKEQTDKEYDFVYFANNLNKAFDLAIEAFSLVHQKYPNMTLDILGGSSEDEMSLYVSKVKELNLERVVIFEGKLPTHDDVLKHIRKSKYALLPLKTDYISGTIREAMANGLPVVTTTTEGTPLLNKNDLCVLLSPIGDHAALASNMLRLIEEPGLTDILTENSYKLSESVKNNKQTVKKWHEAYFYVLKHYKKGASIPQDFLL
jgi:glycosyltransferase involved in cell wall biosynthesis